MLLYSAVAANLCRLRYYFAWKLGACGIHASGISYEKSITDSSGQLQPIFSKHLNANFMKVEGTYVVRDKISNWNIGVQKWLRRCIYERVKSNGQFITFMVSAFWHGFYGGYYISFSLWFLMVFLSQLVFRLNLNYPVVGRYFDKTGLAGKVLLWVIVTVVWANFGTYFFVLSLKKSWRILVDYKFVPVLAVLIPTLILQFSGLCRKRKDRKPR